MRNDTLSAASAPPETSWPLESTIETRNIAVSAPSRTSFVPVPVAADGCGGRRPALEVRDQAVELHLVGQRKAHAPAAQELDDARLARGRRQGGGRGEEQQRMRRHRATRQRVRVSGGAKLIRPSWLLMG